MLTLTVRRRKAPSRTRATSFDAEPALRADPLAAPRDQGDKAGLVRSSVKPSDQIKKDQLALVLMWSLRRPGPNDPGGLGAEESETERTEPTQ